MKLINTRGKPDYILLGAVILLALIGLLFIYSASYYMAERDFSNKFYYFTKQAVGFVVGVAAMLLASRLNLDILKKFSLPLLAVSLVLLGLVFVPGLGIENYGAKRWVGFGGFSFQPSEIANSLRIFCRHLYVARKNRYDAHIAHASRFGERRCSLSADYSRAQYVYNHVRRACDAYNAFYRRHEAQMVCISACCGSRRRACNDTSRAVQA